MNPEEEREPDRSRWEKINGYMNRRVRASRTVLDYPGTALFGLSDGVLLGVPSWVDEKINGPRLRSKWERTAFE